MTEASGPILLVLPTLGRGGAERVFVDLAGGLAGRGHDVHLAWASGAGELAPSVSPTVTAHDLGCARTATAVPAVRSLIGSVRPRVVVSALFHGNLLAAAATRGRRDRPSLVFTEHVELATLPRTAPRRLIRWSPRLVPLVYRSADAVVAVSAGVAEDLRTVGRLPASLVEHIPNPVDLDRIAGLASVAPSHPWLRESTREAPVLVAAGRLSPVKGFDVLLRALAACDASTRLVILGEGDERAALEREIRRLGLVDRVALPGATDNPYADMAAADLFVSSSRTEALPTVLIEALHVGCPVVAADCSAGVREVLDRGGVGRLTPVDDEAALAAALAAELAAPTSPPVDAMDAYAIDTVSERYEALIDQVT